MRLLLIRHGETALNAARILQPPDTPLSERGLAQAAALARRLARRADRGALVQRPAARLARPPWPSPAAAPSGPSRCCRAQLRRLARAALRQPRFRSAGRPRSAAGGESAQAFDERIARAWAQAEAAAAELPGALALVTHGLVIRRLLKPASSAGGRAAAGAHRQHLADRGRRPTAARQPGRLHRHLDAARADDPQALSGG